MTAMGFASPNNDEERAKAALVDIGYDAGWTDAIEAAAGLVEQSQPSLAAEIRKLASDITKEPSE